MGIQKPNEKLFFGKNMTFTKIISVTFNDLNSGSVVHKTNALDH